MMNTNPPDDSFDMDELDQLLLEEPAYIDDDGFSRRVIETLPARSHRWLVRRAILGTSTIVAVLGGWMAFPQGQDIATWTRVALNTAFAAPTMAIAAIAALGLAVLSASVAWLLQEK